MQVELTDKQARIVFELLAERVRAMQAELKEIGTTLAIIQTAAQKPEKKAKTQ